MRSLRNIVVIVGLTLVSCLSAQQSQQSDDFVGFSRILGMQYDAKAFASMDPERCGIEEVPGEFVPNSNAKVPAPTVTTEGGQVLQNPVLRVEGQQRPNYWRLNCENSVDITLGRTDDKTIRPFKATLLTTESFHHLDAVAVKLGGRFDHYFELPQKEDELIPLKVQLKFSFRATGPTKADVERARNSWISYYNTEFHKHPFSLDIQLFYRGRMPMQLMPAELLPPPAFETKGENR